MIKRLVGLIVILFILLILTLTNPGLNAHKLVVKEKAFLLIDKKARADSTSLTELHDRINGEQGIQLKKLVVDDLLKKGISRSNYVLFSTTNLDYKGQTGVAGYGLLGNVFLNAKIDKAVISMITESAE